MSLNIRKTKKPYIKKILYVGTLIAIISIAFLFNPQTTIPQYQFHIIDFSLENNTTKMRTGYPITVTWSIMGLPTQACIKWGDQSEDIADKLIDKNGVLVGSTSHEYTLQGRYYPTLTVWDKFGVKYSKSVEIIIQNDPLPFEIMLYDKKSNSIIWDQIYEDQEVVISVDSIYILNQDIEMETENFSFVYDFVDSQISSQESNVNYRWENEGNYSLTVSIIDSQGVISQKSVPIEVINRAPNAQFEILSKTLRAQSKLRFSAEMSTDTPSDMNTLQYIWNWGDNSMSWGKYSSHIYSLDGEYTIELIVIDDNGVSVNFSQNISLIGGIDFPNNTFPPDTDIIDPFITIGTFPKKAFEDEQIQFTPEIQLHEGNLTDYFYFWSFGDAAYSFERAPKHAWTEYGNYTIELNVRDIYGNNYFRYDNITVIEKAPEILGPFSFQGVEGKAIILDVEVYDALLDQPHLKYHWFNQKNVLISINKKPIVVLDDGEYTYILNVTDLSGLTSSCEIIVTVHPVSPEIYVPNYMYYGPPGNKYINDGLGKIWLRAYSQDCNYDLPELDFRWYIWNGRESYDVFDNTYANYSETIFQCRETTIYQGQVRVTDPSGKIRVATFEIFSQTEEPSEDTSIEQLEKVLDIKLSSPQNSQDSPDSDGDHLSDYYEISVLLDPFDFDTDNDGLWDGYDDSGIGELPLGTSATNPDSDGDGLMDGVEYFGYDISINYFENTSTIHVSSDPLRFDADLDGISDYEEYLSQSHPRLQDSDSDGLNDLEDPYPTTWDNDGDYLSDFMELNIGTDINNSDSDGDGLKDGEEVNGWGIMSFKTSPTCPDTDHDFVQDSAEFLSYKVKLEDEYGKDIRVNLTEPVSLYFSKFFTKAAVAQITFALSFGEYGSDDNQTYGIEENEIVDLNVIISKPSDDLILFDSTTNNTRHYSQIVDITELMNNETLGSNYHGEYIIEAKDVNGEAIPGCLLEKFQLDFSRYLDPNCPDFDSDGIMDGVEMDLLVRGIDTIDIRDFYNCSESGTQCSSESGESNEFSLEIPYTGTVYDASLCLEIISEDQLTGRGNVSINLIKKSIKLNEETPILLNEFQNFNEDDYFFYEENLNLSNLIERDKINEYYGEYLLTVDIQSTNQNETFHLSKFFIETDTFVYAGPQDRRAWITDAALNDTDNDGWSDYYEIFVSKCNPLSKDTDGDKAWDPDDRDPLRNVMIEIRPISATFWNQYFPYPTPTLQIIVRFHINDLIDHDFSEESNVIGFCTTPQIASSYPTWWGAYRTAWWNEGVGHHYYFDINDDETVQSDNILFSFQLWQVLTELPDVDLFAGAWCSQSYTIGEVGHCELLEVVNNGDRVSCEVETIAIERANTIAVFDPNETVFNGHYQESERMNIIQLYVTEDGHYPGTISFEHEVNESIPINWDESQGWLDQSNSGQNPYITDEIDGHSKVLQFHDTSSSGRGYLTHQWDERYITGQLECWVRLTSNNSRAYIIIRDGSDSNSIFLRFDSTGYIQCRDGTEYYSIKTYKANEWYHLRFKWNCNDDWHLWINGQNQDIPVDMGSRIKRGFEFYGTPLAMNELSLQTDSASNDYSFYVDAVGYSFDPYYSMGDNLIRSDSTGTPFQPGLNVIVIPTALFSHTLLNSYFQSEQLYKTPLYSDEEGIFDFYSIDRDGNIVDDQCGDTDFVFIRYDLLAQEAMEILNSLLTCAINQSVDGNNETVTKFARILEYASTKINGTKAVMMNLPQGLLSFIPWISDFVNSPYGDTPTAFNFLGLLLGGLLIFLFPLAGIVITIFVTIALFSVMFRDIARTIGMAILTFLAKLLWILIRVALLIFFFIMLALEIIITVPLFLAMGISFALFSLFLDMDVQFGVNCIPLYGQDTRIGHVLIDIRGCNFLLEAWVKWIYWEFFDLFIPYVDMNLELDSDSPLTNPPEDPSNGIGTFLTCGFDQLSEYKFNFHTIYWDTPYNTQPEYVNLTLLSPLGIRYNYSMDISPVGYKSIEYWVGREDLRTGDIYTYDEIDRTFIPPNWYRGVMFNVTVDFERDFTTIQRDGQWYYQFHAKAERANSSEAIWPIDEFAIGPFFNESGMCEETDIQCLLYSDLIPYSGHAHQEFNFSVTWADYDYNTLPNHVYLILGIPNGSIFQYEMYNHSSYQNDYSMVSEYGNVTFTEFLCTLNLSEYVDNETTLFKHYYKAIHSNGDYEYLFNTQYVDELGRIIESGNESDYLNATEVDAWFEGPLVFPYSNGEPFIKKWEVQDLTNNKYLTKFGFGDMIWEEMELVFWLYVYDSDRSENYAHRPLCYAPGFPMVTLVEKGDPTHSIVLDEPTWSCYDYDLQADIYFAQIGADQIGAGMWNFEFTVNDTQGNIFQLSQSILPKLWIVGSIDEIFRVRKEATSTYGYLPLYFFIAFAGLSHINNYYLQIAVTISTLITAITFAVLLIFDIINLLGIANTGGLFGLGLALVFIVGPCLLTGLSFSASDGLVSISDQAIRISNIFGSIQMIIHIIGGFIYTFTELEYIIDLLFIVGDVFEFMGLSIALGFVVNGLSNDSSRGGGFKASTWIKWIIRAYAIFLLIAGVCAFVFASLKCTSVI